MGRRPLLTTAISSPALRGRLLRLLRRAGLDVRVVARGAVVVARRPGPAVHKLAPGMVLITKTRRVRREWFTAEKAISAYVAQEHVAQLLRMYRVNCVLDVGANRGQYARRLRRAGYRGHIVSFEPVPDTFAELQAAASADARWTVHQCAVGDYDGHISINVVPGTMSSVLEPTPFGASRYAQLRAPTRAEVPIRRLDGLLDEVLAPVPDPRPYLKLDTQGYDLQAFAGLGERVREFVGMQSEVAIMQIYDGVPRMPEAVATYEAAGFAITGLLPVSRQSATGRVLEYDCVMVRAELV